MSDICIPLYENKITYCFIYTENSLSQQFRDTRKTISILHLGKLSARYHCIFGMAWESNASKS